MTKTILKFYTKTVPQARILVEDIPAFTGYKAHHVAIRKVRGKPAGAAINTPLRKRVVKGGQWGSGLLLFSFILLGFWHEK